jgi:hypothetical protein
MAETIFAQYAVKLIVNKICIDYQKTIETIQGSEPEMFIESWLRHNIEHSTKKFDDEVTKEFFERLAKDGVVH